MNYLQIQPVKSWLSDHCALTHFIQFAKVIRNKTTKGNLQKILPMFVWNEQVCTSFIDKLNETKVESSIEAVNLQIIKSDSSSSCNDAVGTLINLINSLCISSRIKTKKSRRTSDTKHKSWFDRECKEIKRQLSKLDKDISREPKDSDIRAELYAKKKKVQNLNQKQETCL